MNPVKIGLWIAGAVVIIGILLVAFPFTTIDTGEKGVVLRWGAVNRTLDQGPHFLTPIAETVKKIDTRVQKEQTDASAASLDLQNVNTTVAVNYNVDADKVAEIYTQIGTEYKTRIIDPAVQEIVKAVTAKYTANNLLSKRADVSDEIKQGLIARLQPYFIHVTDVSIVNFSFSPAFETAIESKVAAEQNALAAKNKLDQAQYEAQAIRVKSEAANNEKYVQLQQLEVERAAVDKWDGHLPAQMIPGSALPFINLTK